MFHEGDKVRSVNPPSDDYKLGEVVKWDHEKELWEVVRSVNPPSDDYKLGEVVKWDQEKELWEVMWYPSYRLGDPDRNSVSHVAGASITRVSAEEEIAILTEQLLLASYQADINAKKADSLRNALVAFESVMREVKDEQGWCDSGTNEIIHRINREMDGHWYIEPYASDYRVEFEVTIPVTVTVSAVVEASDGDSAWEMIEDSPESWLDDQYLRDAISESLWEIDSTDISNVNVITVDAD